MQGAPEIDQAKDHQGIAQRLLPVLIMEDVTQDPHCLGANPQADDIQQEQ